MKNIAIIVAGGRGRRMGKPKQFLKIAGRPMIAWTLSAFQDAKEIDGIILVAAKEQMEAAHALRFPKIIAVVAGGKERADSVRNGLKILPDSAQIVLVHDGARPAIDADAIKISIAAAKKFGAAVVCVPVKDTLKEANSRRHEIIKTVDRTRLWQAQTPQVFQANLLKKAYSKNKIKATDDAALVEKMGVPVRIVAGKYDNIKVTTKEDLSFMEAILKKRKRRFKSCL